MLEHRARDYVALLSPRPCSPPLVPPHAVAQEDEPSTDVSLTLLHNNDGESMLFERLQLASLLPASPHLRP